LQGKGEELEIENVTSASLLLGELVDEDGNANSMDGLSSNEEVVVIMNDQAKEEKGRDGGDNGEDGLHRVRLPA